MIIETFSHYYKVTLENKHEEYFLYGVKNILTIHNYQAKETISKCYYIRAKENKEFRFHINTLDRLLDTLKDKNYNNFRVVHHQPILHDKIVLPAKPNWKLRDEQLEPYNYILNNDTNTKALTLQTGKGKTAVSVLALSKISGKFAMVIKPAFLEKWTSDVVNILDIDPLDVMVVVGGDQMRLLIYQLQERTLDCKVYIFSNRTFSLFIEEYEKDAYMCKELYGITPDEMWDLLKINTLLIDEVHMDFNMVMKTLMFTNVQKVIGLSATLDTNNREVKNMYQLVFPEKTRFQPPSYDKYVNVYSCGYNIDNTKGVRVSEFGRTSYSHTAFEKSLLKRKVLLRQYVKMIKVYIEELFLKSYQKGDKLAVFCSTVKMCEEVCDYLSLQYPEFDVRTYVGKDPYKNVIEPDIRVTTIGSAGTAIDIPGLTTVLLTINVLSLQSNLQTIGRLRKIDNREVNFGYLYCKNIRQHVNYHNERTNMLTGKTKSYRMLDYNQQLVNPK